MDSPASKTHLISRQALTASSSARQFLVGPLCLLAAGCLLAHLAPTAQAGGGMTNFGDCMKNPFAPACRGISAKRSPPPPPPPMPLSADGRTVVDEQALGHWRAQMLAGRRGGGQSGEQQAHWLARLLLSDALARGQVMAPRQVSADQAAALYQLLAIEQLQQQQQQQQQFELGRAQSAGNE